jgi:DNA-binding CsgD family transcriptional regulator
MSGLSFLQYQDWLTLNLSCGLDPDQCVFEAAIRRRSPNSARRASLDSASGASSARRVPFAKKPGINTALGKKAPFWSLAVCIFGAVLAKSPGIIGLKGVPEVQTYGHMPPAETKRLGELEDEVKLKDARIKELREELAQANELINQMREQLEDSNALIDSWIEAFDMVLTEGGWDFAPWKAEHEGYHEQYMALLREWNTFVPEYNAIVAPTVRGLGRPLAASESQQQEVLELRKAGVSLRAIAERTGLTLRTVRTIVGRKEGTDRTTKRAAELRRLELSRARMNTWRARKRTRDALPKRINKTRKRGEELVKVAKRGRT